MNTTRIMVILFLGVFMRSSAAESLLDRPFQGGWYKKALEALVVVWTDLRALQDRSALNCLERDVLYDACLGRLAFIIWCFDQMHPHDVSKLGLEDIHTFADLLYKAQQLWEAVADDERFTYASYLLNRAQKTMEVFIFVLELGLIQEEESLSRCQPARFLKN